MKTQNLNRADLKFIREITAIPLKYRKSYYAKILSRKNAPAQKNIKFIEYVYNIIKRDKPEIWDDKYICSLLNISEDRVRWYKYKFLRNLRYYYLCSGIYSPKFEKISKEPDVYEAKLKTAETLISMALRREAHAVLIKLERDYKKNVRASKQSPILLSSIYEKIASYYFGCRNIRKFNLYFQKFKKLISKKNLTESEHALLKIRFYFIHSYKHLFRITTGQDCKIALEYAIKAYSEAKRINDSNYIFHLGYFIVNTAISSKVLLDNYNIVLEYINENYNLAVKLKKIPEQNVFKALNAEYNLQNGISNYDTVYKEVKNCRKKIKQTTSNKYWINCINSIYFRLNDTDTNLKKWLRLLREDIKYCIISSQQYHLWWNIYIYNAYKSYNKIYSLKITNSSGVKTVIVDKIGFQHINRFESLVLDGLNSYKQILSYFRTSIIYRDILWLEFWKGLQGNFEKSLYYIRAVERIKKRRKLVLLPAYTLLKTGITISDELNYHKKDAVLKKFSLELKNLENEFKADPRWDIYSVLYKIAEVLNTKSVWKIIKDINRKIFDKNPNAISINDIAIESLYTS